MPSIKVKELDREGAGGSVVKATEIGASSVQRVGSRCPNVINMSEC